MRFLFLCPLARLPHSMQPQYALPLLCQQPSCHFSAPSLVSPPSLGIPFPLAGAILRFPFDFSVRFGCILCRLSWIHMFSPSACQISPMQFCEAIELPLVVQPYPRLYPFMPFPPAKPTTSDFLQRLPRNGRPFCRIYTAKKVLPRRESTFGTSEGLSHPETTPQRVEKVDTLSGK